MELKAKINPWPSIYECQLFLKLISGGVLSSSELNQLKRLPVDQIVDWVVELGLGPITRERTKNYWNEIANQLIGDFHSAKAENSLHLASLVSVWKLLEEKKVPPVVLKGAAIAQTAYGDFGLRPMSDVDLWVKGDQFDNVIEWITSIGYISSHKSDRPLELQKIVQGEVELIHPKWGYGAIDLHMSPYHGWWHMYASNVDDDGMWSRTEEFVIADDMIAHRLSPEDMIIHLAVHLAINEHFSPHTAIRSMLDIALVSNASEVDWATVANRAKEWRVYKVVTFVLALTGLFFNVNDSHAMSRSFNYKPLSLKFANLFVSSESILQRKNISSSNLRYIFIILMIDRFTDSLRFILRAFWPTKAWLRARYGRNVSNLYHLFQVIKHRKA